MATPLRLADITGHVDRLIKQFESAIEAILDGKTAEEPYIGALFDCGDREGMDIYFEVGLEPGGPPGSYLVLSVLQQPLDEVLTRHRYRPIDELPGYMPGTILFYVFTHGVVVARRFETFAGVRRGLREVRLTRDMELPRTGLSLEGPAAVNVIVQWVSPVLRRLWDGSTDRVALIDRASHGAKVGYIARQSAIASLTRLTEDVTTPDRDYFSNKAQSLAAGARPGEIDCIFQGWGPLVVMTLMASSFEVRPNTRTFERRDEDLLAEYITACRDQKRALGIFEKALDKLTAWHGHGVLAELLAMLRHRWNDCDAILESIKPVLDAFAAAGEPNANAARLWIAANALWQATTERKRGGAINASGGSG